MRLTDSKKRQIKKSWPFGINLISAFLFILEFYLNGEEGEKTNPQMNFTCRTLSPEVSFE